MVSDAGLLPQHTRVGSWVLSSGKGLQKSESQRLRDMSGRHVDPEKGAQRQRPQAGPRLPEARRGERQDSILRGHPLGSPIFLHPSSSLCSSLVLFPSRVADMTTSMDFGVSGSPLPQGV